MGGKIRITLIKSLLGSKPSHRKTVKALGLRRVNHTVEHEDTPQIRGMIFHVKHLVSVEK